MFNTKEYYKKITKEKINYREILKNFIQAFISGGLLSIAGQGIIDIYSMFADQKDAILYMTMTIILIVGFLTAFGIYDDIGQICKCGIAIPISGFANASISSAMEYKKEGLVLGIGANLFKLSGSVIVLGSVSAIIVSTVRYILWMVI